MMRVSASAQRGPKKVSDCRGLELQVVVGPPTWVLGAELGSSAKAASTLDT